MSRFLTLAILSFIFASHAAARENVEIVGSSTVFPFTSAVADTFYQTTEFPRPRISSTGSGAGFKLFCAGMGADHPDITSASRRMKPNELALCAQNGVGSITEARIGYDGVILARSNRGESLNLTLEDVFLALAAEVPTENDSFTANQAVTWTDVNPTLAPHRIQVVVPSGSSGTYDSFIERALAVGGERLPSIQRLAYYAPDHAAEVLTNLRGQPQVINAGENDEIIVTHVQQRENTIGVLGYNYYQRHRATLTAETIDGIAPSVATIADGSYPLSRPLFIYIKNSQLGQTPGLAEFVQLYMTEEMLGNAGRLSELGLVPLDATELNVMQQVVREQQPFLIAN